MTSINTASLRLYETFLIDMAKLAAANEGGTRSQEEIATLPYRFYRFTNVVKNWWKFWLANTRVQYIQYPTPMVVQLVFAIDVLHQWATLTISDVFHASNDGGSPAASAHSSASSSISNAADTSFELFDAGDVLKESITSLVLGSNMLELLVLVADKSR